MTPEDTGFKDIDLDQHLAEGYSEDEMTEEESFLQDLTPEEQALLKKIQEKQMQQDHILETFRQLENKPTDDEIEHLKNQVGDVFLVSFSEKENFLFRSLKRLEWRGLMQQIQKLDDMKKAEAIVIKACLFPQMNQQNINVLTAGAVETLRDLILQASNFMGPEIAMQLVRKL